MLSHCYLLCVFCSLLSYNSSYVFIICFTFVFLFLSVVFHFVCSVLFYFCVFFLLMYIVFAFYTLIAKNVT